MSYETVDAFCRTNIAEYASNGRTGYGQCPFCKTPKSILINYSTKQFRCAGCQVTGGLLTLARKLGVSAPVEISDIAPENQSSALQSGSQQSQVAATGAPDVNEPLPPPSFDYVAGCDKETALRWFSRWFFDPFADGSPLPSEYKKLCMRVYDEVSNHLPSAGGRVIEKLDQVFDAKNHCTTRDEFESYLVLIAQLWELSQDAKRGLVRA